MREKLKWGEVKKLLVEAFELPQYQVMKRFELKALRLGQGKHKTLPIFNAAFDKLARHLYPIGTDFENNIILDRVLADEYSSLLELSDVFLWRDVVKTGPRTLTQWKMQTMLVWSAREVLRTSDQRHRHMHGGIGRGGGRPHPQGTGSASLQEMDVREEYGDWESEEDSTPPPSQASASVQQMQSTRRNNNKNNYRGNSRRPRNDRPRLLTDEQMRIVWEKRLCLQCYKPGHRIGDAECKERGKPRRKPTEAKLTA